MLRQETPIGRALRMEGVCRLSTATQMDGGQRGEIVGVDKVGRLHTRVSKLGAQHLAEGIGGQPCQKCRGHPEAPQANRNVETRATRMRLVRQMPTNCCRGREVDERVTRDHDRGIDIGLGDHTDVSRTASSKVRAASAVVGSVKNCSATAGAMVKQSTPWRASATMSGTLRMLASSTFVVLPVAMRT